MTAACVIALPMWAAAGAFVAVTIVRIVGRISRDASRPRDHEGYEYDA